MNKFKVGNIITNKDKDYLAKITGVADEYYDLMLLSSVAFGDDSKDSYPKGYTWSVSHINNYILVTDNDNNKTEEELLDMIKIMKI